MNPTDTDDPSSSHSKSEVDDDEWIEAIEEEHRLTLALLVRLASDGANWRVTFGDGFVTVHSPEGPLTWSSSGGLDEFARFRSEDKQEEQSFSDRVARLKTLIKNYDRAVDQIQRVRAAMPAPPGRPRDDGQDNG